MRSNEMEDLASANAGEICAVFGLDCATGGTLRSKKAGKQAGLMVFRQAYSAGNPVGLVPIMSAAVSAPTKARSLRNALKIYLKQSAVSVIECKQSGVFLIPKHQF